MPDPKGKYGGYLINVAHYQNGVTYGQRWTHVSGWSESVLRFIRAVEGE